MLVPLPGSQHTLGLFMVSEFFARAGWRVWGELAATEADILRMAKTQWFDVDGLIRKRARAISGSQTHDHGSAIGIAKPPCRHHDW